MEWWQLILDHLIELAGTVAIGVLLIGAKALLNALERKLNIDVDDRVEMMIQKAVRDGVLYAEQAAKRAAKLEKKTISPDDKLALAVNHALHALEQSGVEDIARDFILRLVEAKVAELNGTRLSPGPGCGEGRHSSRRRSR